MPLPTLLHTLSRLGKKWHHYLRAGGGIYRNKAGANETGFNVGLGATNATLADTELSLALDYHLIGSERSNQLLILHLGYRFK